MVVYKPAISLKLWSNSTIKKIQVTLEENLAEISAIEIFSIAKTCVAGT